MRVPIRVKNADFETMQDFMYELIYKKNLPYKKVLKVFLEKFPVASSTAERVWRSLMEEH